MEWLKRKWLDFIVTAAISIMTVLIGFKMTASDTDAREYKQQLDRKAELSYVKDQDEEIKKQCLQWKQDVDANYTRLYNQNTEIIKRIDILYELTLRNQRK
jgi:hypothetical protein